MRPRSRAEQQKPKCGEFLVLLRRVAHALKGRGCTQRSRFAGSKCGETCGECGREFLSKIHPKGGMPIFDAVSGGDYAPSLVVSYFISKGSGPPTSIFKKKSGG